MKKHLIFTAMLSVIAAGNIQAQQGTGYKLYDFSSTQWIDADGYPNDLLLGTFNKVSANGEYAVGYDDQYLLTSFMWKRSTPDKIELVNSNYNYRTRCHDVANDGTAVGCYESAYTQGMRPAYRSADGEWTLLPVPEDYSLKTAQGGIGIDEAAAVTSDGKYIAGHVYVKIGEKETSLGKLEVTSLLPALWTKNGYNYELTTVYRDLGKAGESYQWNGSEFELVADSVKYNIFYVYNISDDGRTIVGMNTADCGGQNPAIIRDGKLMQIYNCDNPDTYTFNGGICNSIDAAGNIYGYFVDDFMNMTNFVLTSDNKLEFVDDWLICGTADGRRFTQQTYSLPYTLDCSDDGSVIVGGSIASMGFGLANAPALLLADDTPATGVDRIDAIRNTVSISYKGNVLCVNGEYDRADIYNAQGALIAQLGQGVAYNLGAQPAGTYIVKVTTANGVKTFKVAR